MTMYDVKTMQRLCRMSGLADLVLSHNQSGGEPLKLPVALYLFYNFPPTFLRMTLNMQMRTCEHVRLKPREAGQITSDLKHQHHQVYSEHEDSQPDRGTAARAVYYLLLRRLT